MVISAAIGAPVFKVGTVSPTRLEAREDELSDDQFGSMSEGSSEIEPGFRWSLEPLDATITFLAGSPVSAGPRDLRFVMPADMSVTAFENSFNAILAPASLGEWSRSAAGLAYLTDRNIDPALCRRSSPARYGEGIKRKVCRELLVIRPRKDARALGRIIECVIYDFVMGTQ